MPDDPYTLSDLARLADVTPRTIRYYVAQGLLPSPEAAGPATRYGEGHLLRLRFIRRLQRDHLPLAEIRARLERMDDEAVRQVVDASGADAAVPPPAETLAFVRDLMHQSGVLPSTRPGMSPSPARAMRRDVGSPTGGALLRRVELFEPMTPESYPLRSEPSPSMAPPSPDATPASAPAPAMMPLSPSAPGTRSVAGDRSTWERLAVTADVEIHVRRPLDRQSNKKVEQLARIARELFAEES